MSILPAESDIEKLKQKGKINEVMKLRKVLRNGRDNLCQDEPEHADEYTQELKRGDVVVSATDGVYDNLFNYEIQHII